MNALYLVLYMNLLLPPRTEADVRLRMQMAEAIVSVTDDLEEQLALAQIPRYESAYREDVATCKLLGKQGEQGAWQVLARSADERASLCVSLAGDARLALARIRESRSACRHLPTEERLAIYARGRCDSDEGRRLSRIRWPSARALERYRHVMADRPERLSHD